MSLSESKHVAFCKGGIIFMMKDSCVACRVYCLVYNTQWDYFYDKR